MKRYDIGVSPAAGEHPAVATFYAKSNGRFVEHKDVLAIIQKAEYWEDQFRKEWKRVGELCKQRDRIRATLKRLLDEQV